MINKIPEVQPAVYGVSNPNLRPIAPEIPALVSGKVVVPQVVPKKINSVTILTAIKEPFATPQLVQFAAKVNGQGAYSENALWSIKGNVAEHTEITPTGLLTLDAGEFVAGTAEHQIFITATAADDNKVFTTYSIVCVGQ